MMFYKQGGSDDFLRESGTDMRRLQGGLAGPNYAKETLPDNWQKYVLDAPPPPVLTKDEQDAEKTKPFTGKTAQYGQILTKLYAAAQSFLALKNAGAMTVAEYQGIGLSIRGIGMNGLPAAWTVATATSFASMLAAKLTGAKLGQGLQVVKTIAQTQADASKWFALLNKWLGTSQAEFDALVAGYGADYAVAVIKVGDYTQDMLAQKSPQGHTKEMLTEADDLREKLDAIEPSHPWLTNAGWDPIVKSFKGSGSWTYAQAVALRDAVKSELAKAYEAKTKGFSSSLVSGSILQKGLSVVNAVAMATAQKITAVLTDAMGLYNQIQPLTGMTNDQYNTLALQSGMDAKTKTWTLAAATAFRDALQKIYHDAAQGKLDADAKKAADDASIKKILADTDAYYASQTANKTLTKTQAEYDTMKAAAKGLGDWTVDSVTAFQKAIYALPLTAATPVVYYSGSSSSGGGGGGGGGGGFGEGMALFQQEKPPVVAPVVAPVPPKAEGGSTLPVLALLGAAAFAFLKK
jgi:hypothetical protein